MKNSTALDLLKNTDPGLRITGIGSVPFVDPDEACGIILKHCPLFPYVPQLIKRDFRENMFLQFSENLPCLTVDLERKHIVFDDTRDRTEELDELYENMAHNRYEHFGISPVYASGLPVMLEKCRMSANPFIKAQVTGPITYLLSLPKRDGRPLIYDDEFSEAIMFGLAMKGLWQAQEIRKADKTPLLFFDEPSLSQLGSAYTLVPDDKAWSLLGDLLGTVKERERDLIIGVHCCGNTDWGMLVESGVDIMSLDSYSCGDKLLLYPEEMKRFLKRDGFIAFGIVPTSEYGKWTAEQTLYDHFLSLLADFEERGIPKEELLDHALFTPACGMGPSKPADANRILELVVLLTRRIQELRER